MPTPSNVSPRVAALGTLSLLVLTACGGGGGGGGTTVPPVGPPPPSGPPAVTTQAVFAQVSLSSAIGLWQAPADETRWFAVEQSGRIMVFDNDANATESVFLDIRPRVDATANEGGFLGLAFHPDFANNGEAFLSYTRSGAPLESVISRFRSTDGNLTLDPLTEEIILTVAQPFTNHNAGNILFGPDGFLYIAFGDGGSSGDPAGHAQNTTTLLGSIARIDVDSGSTYAIVSDNPFAANARCTQGFGAAACPEIYAWGLRNPWRFSFDSQTGELWAGDVGQDSWEEVNRIELGSNYGWNEREGAHCFEPPTGCSLNFEDPISEYDHSQGSSVTGGYVYRGSAIADLQGHYVFGDFISGRLWAVPADSPVGTDPVEIADTDFRIPTFAEDNNGELYLIDIDTGSIHQIVSN